MRCRRTGGPRQHGVSGLGSRENVVTGAGEDTECLAGVGTFRRYTEKADKFHTRSHYRGRTDTKDADVISLSPLPSLSPSLSVFGPRPTHQTTQTHTHTQKGPERLFCLCLQKKNTLGGVDMSTSNADATFLMRDVRVLVHHHRYHTLVQLNQRSHTLLASGLIH